MRTYFCENCGKPLTFIPMFEKIGGTVESGLMIPRYEFRQLNIKCPHCKTPDLDPKDYVELGHSIRTQFQMTEIEAANSIRTVPGEVQDHCPFCGQNSLRWSETRSAGDNGARQNALCGYCCVEFTEILEVVDRRVTTPPKPEFIKK